MQSGRICICGFSFWINLYTDSAGTIGLGCGWFFFQESWTYFEWPLDWENKAILRDITLLELAPIVLSVMIWSQLLSGKQIQFLTNIMALVSILNSQSSR